MKSVGVGLVGSSDVLVLSPVEGLVGSTVVSGWVPLLSLFMQWQQSSLPEAVLPQIPFSEVALMSNRVESESKLSSWLVSTQLPIPPNLAQMSVNNEIKNHI